MSKLCWWWKSRPPHLLPINIYWTEDKLTQSSQEKGCQRKKKLFILSLIFFPAPNLLLEMGFFIRLTFILFVLLLLLYCYSQIQAIMYSLRSRWSYRCCWVSSNSPYCNVFPDCTFYSKTQVKSYAFSTRIIWLSSRTDKCIHKPFFYLSNWNWTSLH